MRQFLAVTAAVTLLGTCPGLTMAHAESPMMEESAILEIAEMSPLQTMSPATPMSRAVFVLSASPGETLHASASTCLSSHCISQGHGFASALTFAGAGHGTAVAVQRSFPRDPQANETLAVQNERGGVGTVLHIATVVLRT